MTIYKFILNILSFTIITAFFFKPFCSFANSKDIESWFKKAVLVKSYQQSYDWLNPWEKLEIRTKSGMALVVNIYNSKNKSTAFTTKTNKLYLLTTADMVTDATLIEISRKDFPRTFIAKITLIDYAANIALLDVDSFKFWEGLNPVNWDDAKPLKNSKKIKI